VSAIAASPSAQESTGGWSLAAAEDHWACRRLPWGDSAADL